MVARLSTALHSHIICLAGRRALATYTSLLNTLVPVRSMKTLSPTHTTEDFRSYWWEARENTSWLEL